MAETCEVCGRELSGRRDPVKHPDQCWRGLDNSATRECFERGLKREKTARAEAERERERIADTLANAFKDMNAAEAALAAEKAAREKAEAKATQYEADWYAAKSEFGDAMAKARERTRAAEARADAAEAKLAATEGTMGEATLRAAEAERALGEARRELDAAWAATGVAGEIRGLTTLDDWVRCHMERHGELKEIVDVQAGIITAARCALAGQANAGEGE